MPPKTASVAAKVGKLPLRLPEVMLVTAETMPTITSARDANSSATRGAMRGMASRERSSTASRSARPAFQARGRVMRFKLYGLASLNPHYLAFR